MGFRGTEYCWLGAMEVESDPLVDSAPTSRTVDCEGDIVERLDRLGSFFSSESFVLDGLWPARGEDASLSVLDDLDFGVSARAGLLDLVESSLFDRRLEDDLFTSVLILMLAFFALGFSASLSSCLLIVLSLCDDS